MIGVGLIGCGYWGPNLVRNFSLSERTRVAMVCDRDAEALARTARVCATAEPVKELDRLLDPAALTEGGIQN